MRLVLWDIDHTLLDTGGVGSQVFRCAFESATGKRLIEMPDPTGLTEQAIFKKACECAGADKPDDMFGEFAAAQAREYRRRGGDLRAHGRVLPGAQEVLAALCRRDDVVQTVLSGNPRAAGRAKLEAFGLERYLDLEVGAGGDDDAHRPALVPVVWGRVRATYGASYGPRETVVVGDSPADVETARANGCRAVAVATGKTSARQLRALRPDVLLDGLADGQAVLAAVLA